MRPLVRKGAKNTLQVTNGETISAEIYVPITSEQKRIASFFTVLDKKITELKFKKVLLKTRECLAPLKIGKDGRLQEWMEEFEEPEPGHRHISHVYALYPGEQITLDFSPELCQALRKSIEYRIEHGGGQEGWSAAWLINLWARMGEGNKAYALLQHLYRTNMITNLFSRAHGVPQLDAIFGLTAGIGEMLLQSHAGVIRLLPALPKAWKNGCVKGLRARDGFEVDIEWQDGKIQKAKTSLDAEFINR